MAVVSRTSVFSINCLRVTQTPEFYRVPGTAATLSTNRQYSSESPRIIKTSDLPNLRRGTGGRSSFNGIVCTVFGNTGFLGRHLCNRLGKIGTQLVLPHRGDPYDSLRLKLCGDLGQIIFQPFHLRDEESILKCIKYSNVVINLIGCDWETKNFTFHDVHVEGARTLARLCKQANVERFIHVSCLNANPNPTPIILKKGSAYYKSKWEGECAVREEFPDATIVKPADAYGQEDHSYLNVYMQRWRRHLRGMPLWNKGETTEKQPIWGGDVAAGITALVKDPKTAGQTYQFVGPKRYKLSELVDWMSNLQRHEAAVYGHRRLELKYMLLFQLKVYITEMFPGTPFGLVHWEGLEKEHTSDVVIKGIPGLEDLGIYPCTVESRMPWEAKAFKEEASYQEQLGEFDLPEPPKTVPLS